MEKYDLSKMFNLFCFGVAHRGLHNEVIPENSKAAFTNAIKCVLPFETDVHLSKDNALIVNHDNDLGRVTGKAGVIEELTLKEIKDNYLLRDGSKLMTFEELVDLWGEEVPMVLELKAYKGNYQAIHDRIKPILDKVKNPSKLVLISFDESAINCFKDDRWNRGLLVGGGEIASLHDPERFEFLDVAFPLLQEEIIKNYRKAGGLVMSWTPRNENELRIAKAGSDAVTFELLNPSLLREGR